jgi:glycosyltransferase involved in cell wall biosynthesis
VDVRATWPRLAAAPEFYGPRLVINNGLVARMTLRRGRRYVVSSELQRHELERLGYAAAQISVIPNLIDSKKLKRWNKQVARRALGLPEGPLVAFVGHYHDVKGHDVLLRSFRDVLRRVPDARLVLAWSGIGHQDRVHATIAEEGIADRVIELGRLDVGQLFSAADVAVLPYRLTIGQAAYPGTVIEAMWVGVPLVTSDLPLLAELSGGGRTALLAKTGDPADLGRQVTRALTDPALAAQMVEAQRADVAGRFHADACVHRYIGVYEEALSGQANLLQPARN